jgi:hypothetical protein
MDEVVERILTTHDTISVVGASADRQAGRKTQGAG